MRDSGILLHITSLPSPGGVGTMGREAYQFVDFLKRAGCRVWQMLPIGPTGYGESPYQSASTFAGNPILIDLPLLVEQGILDSVSDGAPADAAQVDFEAVKAFKEKELFRAFKQSGERLAAEIAAFAEKNPWAREYALFAAIKEHFDYVKWTDWGDKSLRMRAPDALKAFKEAHGERVQYHLFLQYLFDRQWFALKQYANANGVRLFGDMPIYIAEDSSDTWTHPEVFQLDAELRPTRVAGVPPDYFSINGQLWGNPLYDWKALKRTGYRWWVDRMRRAGELFDMVRIDHFIGFANYYSIPAGASTAKHGVWRVGVGRDLFIKLKKELPNLCIIAEDLGVLSARVKKLIAFCGFPGMRVLQFAFDGDPRNQFLPENIGENIIAYTGTHDNDTLIGWWRSVGDNEHGCARYRLGMDDDYYLSTKMFEALWGCRARTVMLPMQDILYLGGEARMNTPGVAGGNWRWRMLSAAPDAAVDTLRSLNERYERIADAGSGLFHFLQK